MADKDDKQRSYNDEKRELLKLKQGLITEEEFSVKEAPHGDKMEFEVKGAKNKISNFFYHYKWYVIGIAFFTALILFLVITTVTKENGDVRVLVFSEDPEISSSLYFKTNDIELAFEEYTSDFDDNGYVHTEIYYIDMDPDQDINYYYTNQTKIFAEVGLGTAQIYLGDMEQLSTILGDQEENEGFVDLSAMYPDDPHIVNKYYYQIKGTAFAQAANYMESCPENLYIALRSENFKGYKKYNDELAENHRRAAEVFDNIINDNKVSEDLDASS